MKEKTTKEYRGMLILEYRDILEPDTFLANLDEGLKLTYTTAFTYSQESKLPERKKKAVSHILQNSWDAISSYVEPFKNGKEHSIYGIGAKKVLRVQDLKKHFLE